jgi:hypothetical protein
MFVKENTDQEDISYILKWWGELIMNALLSIGSGR